MSTSWTFGPAGLYTAVFDGSSQVTVTQTAGSQFVASFAAATLTAALASPEYQAILTPPATGPAYLTMVATTGTAGVALQNATPTFLTWTAPNDGSMHRLVVFSEMNVASTETGGLVNVGFNDPAGGARTRQLYAAGLASGFQEPAGVTPMLNLVAPGSVCTLTQGSALTAGAATMWAEFWAL
jgi:hypothetical protein